MKGKKKEPQGKGERRIPLPISEKKGISNSSRGR